ncbi:MAG: hypothetical protein AAF382_18500 [Pseudomonadota bacterium]
MLKPLVIAAVSAWPVLASAETVLLMAEEDGCYWCQQWNEDIAHIYPKTAEGRTARLQRYDLHSETPDVVFERRVHYTPTFILVEDGQEVARLEGYPGEDFFWGLLTQMFERAGIPLDTAS